MIIYFLILTDPELSYDNYSEDFPIGFFETEKQAEETAEYYLKNVKGFCDFNCTYHILTKQIADNPDNILPDTIWIVQGWNINENYDETDIIESPCFLTEARANLEINNMKNKYQREEWTINQWKIGETEWKEGFIRMIGDTALN